LERLEITARIDDLSEESTAIDWVLSADLAGKSIGPRGTFLIAESEVDDLGTPDLEAELDLAAHKVRAPQREMTVELRIDGVHMDVVLYRQPCRFKASASMARGLRRPMPPDVTLAADASTPTTGCTVAAHCDDGVFCNGAERCQDGTCLPGAEPCEDLAHCDEDSGACLPCIGSELNLACDTDASGICAIGTTKCDDGSVRCAALHSPGPELCDGLDNDCDGEVDEGVAGTREPCSSGVGACEATGVTVCRADASAFECSVTPTQPSEELCDLVDNDCDGEVDEGNPEGGEPCPSGAAGICSAGILECQAGLLLCVQAVRPAADDSLCNQLDDDCDGEVDEDFISQPTQCGTGDCLAIGQRLCTNGRIEDTCKPVAPCLPAAAQGGV
jgi:hypothetical protein